MGLTASVDLGTHPEWVPEPIPHRYQGTAILDSFSLFYLPNNFILSILKKMSRPVQRRREDAIMSAKSLPV